MTPLEALKALTIWAAEQYGEQASKGSLEVGKLADFAVLDGNPLTMDPTAIKKIVVMETIKEAVGLHAAVIRGSQGSCMKQAGQYHESEPFRLIRVGRWLCTCGAAIGAMGLLGHLVGAAFLTTLVPGLPPMSGVTGLALVLLGGAGRCPLGLEAVAD